MEFGLHKEKELTVYDENGGPQTRTLDPLQETRRGVECFGE